MTQNNWEMYRWIDSLDPDMVSVVLPTYKRPVYLERALHSLAEQKDPPKFEVIVVDDGSPKPNLIKDIVETYVDLMGMNIKLIELAENSGTVSIPRNIGISHISGLYVSPMDDDCFAEPDKLNLLYSAIIQPRREWTLLAFGNRRELAKAEGENVFRELKVVNSRAQDPRRVGLDNGQFIYSAEIYGEIKPCLAINACDWELYKQIPEMGGEFIFVNETVCNYVWHGNNISLTPKPLRKNPADLIQNFKQYFKEGPFKNEVYS
jgi:glycosyltransferase involved in cell wall biosynthesis